MDGTRHIERQPGVTKEKSLILALLLSGVMFYLACFLAADRSVWSDEGMYLSNMHMQWWHYFQPLPLYDQACPPLVSVFYSLMLGIAPHNTYLIRITILCACSLALAYFGWRTATTYETPLTVASLMFLLCNGVVVRYATEIKQYPIEIAVSLILIGFYMQTMGYRHVNGRSGAYLFLLLSVAMSFFSFGVLPAAASLMLERAVFLENRALAKEWRLSLAAFLGIYGLLYLIFFKGLVFIQFNNYLELYKVNLLRDNFNSLFFWKHALSTASRLFVPKPLLVTCGFLALVVAVFARKNLVTPQGAPIRIAFILLSLILLFSGMGLYPLATTRQFLFTLPFMALVIGWAVRQLINFHNRWSLAGMFLIVFLMFFSGIINVYGAYAGKYDFQKTRELYEFIVNSNYKHILVDFSVQPSLEFYATDGRLNDKSLLGKLAATSVAMPGDFRVSSNYPAVFETVGAWQALIPIGQWTPLSHSRDDLYTDWLVSKVPANETVLLATAGPGDMIPHIWEQMTHSIVKRGCRSTLVFENSGVRALRLDCAQGI
jgi:hypothetical protein